MDLHQRYIMESLQLQQNFLTTSAQTFQKFLQQVDQRLKVSALAPPVEERRPKRTLVIYYSYDMSDLQSMLKAQITELLKNKSDLSFEIVPRTFQQITKCDVCLYLAKTDTARPDPDQSLIDQLLTNSGLFLIFIPFNLLQFR